MAKYTQTIHRQEPTNCFSVFDHFVELGLKVLIISVALVSNLGILNEFKWINFHSP